MHLLHPEDQEEEDREEAGADEQGAEVGPEQAARAEQPEVDERVAARRCTITNAASSTAARPSISSVRAEPQP